MIAKRLAFIDQCDDCWDLLADEYQVFDLESWVARAKVIAPSVFYDSPEDEEVEGEVMAENDKFILTSDDSLFCECVRIYQKIL